MKEQQAREEMVQQKEELERRMIEYQEEANRAKEALVIGFHVICCDGLLDHVMNMYTCQLFRSQMREFSYSFYLNFRKNFRQLLNITEEVPKKFQTNSEHY